MELVRALFIFAINQRAQVKIAVQINPDLLSRVMEADFPIGYMWNNVLVIDVPVHLWHQHCGV